MAEPLDATPASAHDPGQGLAEALASVDPGLALAEVMASVLESHGDRPALGERARDPETGRLLPRFDTISYRELWSRVRALAGLWHHDPEYPLGPGDRICTLGFTSTDYATLDLACIHLGAVPVPLQSNAPLSQLAPIVEESGPTVLAASVDRLDTAVDVAIASSTIRRLVVFDHRPGTAGPREALAAARQRLAGAGSPVAVDTLAELIARGRSLPAPPLYTAAPGEDPLSLLIYTSGSTGAPKGAMYTQSLLGTAWYGFSYGAADTPAISVLYLPQSHLAGRYAVMGSLVKGGTGYFTAAGDLSTLFEDIALVRPTELTMVPRLCDMLLQHYRGELDRRADEPGDIEAAVRKELREVFLGGRIAKAFVGTAPLSDELAAFVESVLGFHLYTGYGSTEAGGVLLDTVVQRPPVIDYKLVDVPELGYYATDLPYPRGELLLKSHTLIPGYYRRPDLTATIFDADGYYRTGDVFAETGPDRLVYVDRTKDTLKLSQGEFVAVSRLETVLLGSPLVQHLYLYGNSERAHLLAVVVPTPAALAGCGGDTEALEPLLMESLRNVARKAGRNSYEIPRGILVETEPFSPENGLFTESHKLLRPRLKERYGPALEQLYDQLADGQDRRLRELRRTGTDGPVEETVTRAAQALLGTPGADVRPGTRFTDLGGDSLSALSFSELMEEVFHVDVPVGVILSPANDLAGVARYIGTARGPSGTRRPTFASVHGEHRTEVRARDLTLEKFLDAPALAAAPPRPRPDGDVRTVLLTGATGYLGRFLCLEWLERLAPSGGRLVCLVRGSDATVAARRLEEAFDSGDAALLRRYRKAAGKTLEVLAGDIGEPRLGLAEDTWRELAGTVDLIVHPAALVNHLLPYSELFGPNVVGTAEVIRLALTTRLKPVNHVSTVAVCHGTPAETADENADIRATSPVRAIGQGYADGYATSKWAAEVLLREAHERFGLPVAVFRSDMVLAHSTYSGQVNVPDVLTRLLLSLVATGIAPGSFYRAGARAHYDGLPVDFTAEAVVALGAPITEGHRTFNVLNPHDDGVSLDTFVDWLIEAGHPIRRIDDHGAWITRFTAALRDLPENHRKHSLLPLLGAYAEPGGGAPGALLPAGRFHAAVRDARVGPEQDIPRVSPDLIRKYVTDLRALGLLSSP
ncbi:carboxylic acid reductase [Streptomyces anulatus]|uniref:carboxylic acid reductase n=1 Tax=Streptomyces anulatus TaxID=1892 RepID=UPI00225746F3|nr:carboxylic acid reductase [Streptomyces anulatus]MCX4502364.1 thioester reductase domain-containing protein [Streptomyces anulatus]